jgi:hypothetical protein
VLARVDLGHRNGSINGKRETLRSEEYVSAHYNLRFVRCKRKALALDLTITPDAFASM